MVKPITEYSKEELEEKIVKIKAERERTAEALKKYEEELERREQEVPLGVPLPDKDGAPFVGVYELGFPSEKSFFTFSKRFQDYVTATRDNAKDKLIDIKVLLPLLRKGWVHYCPALRKWIWSNEAPKLKGNRFLFSENAVIETLGSFNINPAENWETSLMECGL